MNEQVPYYLKELKWKARTLATEKNWKYVWITDGKIFARKSDNMRAIRVINEKDLDFIN